MYRVFAAILSVTIWNFSAFAESAPVADASPRGSDAVELFKQTKSFYNTDGAISSFSPEIEQQDSPELGEFQENIKRKSLKQRLQEEEAAYLKKLEAIENAKLGIVQVTNEVKNKNLKTKEDIISEYGSPEEEPEVKAQENAPKAYKAMLASLNAGDEELAYEYAQQYAKYVKGVQTKVKRAAGLTGLAMTSEGVLDENDWGLRGANDFDRALYEKRKAEKESKDAQRTENLSDKAKELINLALEDKVKSPQEDLPEGSISEAEQKGYFANEATQVAYARETSSGGFRSKSGKIDVFFFFGLKDSKSIQAAKEIEKLFGAIKDDSKIRLAALSVDHVSNYELKEFKHAARVSYEALSGGEFAKEMNIKNSPAVVFVNPETGASVIEEGRRGGAFLKERFKLLGGVL